MKIPGASSGKNLGNIMAKEMNAVASSPKPLQFRLSHISRFSTLFLVAISMTLFSSLRAAAQDSADSSQQPQPDVQAPLAQGESDQRPVVSRDTISQDNPPSQNNDQAVPQRPPSPNRPPAAAARTAASVPANFTIPAGKVIFVRLNEQLSSDRNRAGDTFTATLDQPIVVNGWVVARRGETIVGSVTNAKKAGRVKGVSQLGLEVTDVTIVDGQQLPVLTELWEGSAGTSHGTDAAGIATTTGVGTIIGAAADGGAGAGIGAGAGAAAGIALVLLTRGKPTVLGPETALSFRLKQPLTISTENSAQAFLPVGQNDYNSAPTLRRRGDVYPVEYPPYYATCGPYWGCSPYYGYGYYGPAFGFYGGYGFYGGFRGGFSHRGFRR
jgi:hypothetical protein